MKPKNIVILSGAGLSAESEGMRTFRYSNGLWNDHKIEDVCTPEALERDPFLVNDFYNNLRSKMVDIEPNAAHHALAKLQREFDGECHLITQNVDNFLDMAGADVIHMHGELNSALCPVSGQRVEWKEDIVVDGSYCTCCETPSQLRVDIVFFGEMPYRMTEIQSLLAKADLFIAIGTSGKVYPAAGFVHEANHFGARTIEINLEPGDLCAEFDESRQGKATELIPELVEELLGG
ncbi:NAD-dependent deacylase [Vibrio agarivorans]|uniref:protein acetyllysine N-acetyltransferase n=1 Tax=Vibrio agarivorans TaxID=153622 RepID=A0ABT7Y443_9VIBR|nr:NAD-dependent deacylase [Vibrio agarivorans]MDN2482777.1 NAD-dependent deacylase [Vibrio agarivorans]